MFYDIVFIVLILMSVFATGVSIFFNIRYAKEYTRKVDKIYSILSVLLVIILILGFRNEELHTSLTGILSLISASFVMLFCIHVMEHFLFSFFRRNKKRTDSVE